MRWGNTSLQAVEAAGCWGLFHMSPLPACHLCRSLTHMLSFHHHISHPLKVSAFSPLSRLSPTTGLFCFLLFPILVSLYRAEGVKHWRKEAQTIRTTSVELLIKWQTATGEGYYCFPGFFPDCSLRAFFFNKILQNSSGTAGRTQNPNILLTFSRRHWECGAATHQANCSY